MDLFQEKPELKPYFEKSFACVVFGAIAKAGIGIGGAGGQGDVYLLHGGGEPTKIGKATMMQLSVGFQFGGQVYAEIIFFETERDLKFFQSGNFEFSADANAVALTASASAKASTMGGQASAGLTAHHTAPMPVTECKYAKGTAVYTIARGGLMYQATLAGQKFIYKDV